MGGEEVEDEFECRRELTTRIGDEIHLDTEAESRAEVEGIGDAKGNWDSVILEVRIGDCENLEAFPECPVHSTQPAPSLSHFGLGLLVLLLFGFGTFAVRRRHLQH